LNANANLQVADTDVDAGNPVPVEPGTAAVFDVAGTVAVSGVTGSVAASIIDSSGVGYSGSNPIPVAIVSGAGATSAVNISDSSGVGYSGSNPVPVAGTVAVSGVAASVAATIVDSEGAGYSNTNPLTAKIGDGVDTLDLTNTLADNVNATVALPVAAYNYGFEGGT
jgi:hypothetical protein